MYIGHTGRNSKSPSIYKTTNRISWSIYTRYCGVQGDRLMDYIHYDHYPIYGTSGSPIMIGSDNDSEDDRYRTRHRRTWSDRRSHRTSSTGYTRADAQSHPKSWSVILMEYYPIMSQSDIVPSWTNSEHDWITELDWINKIVEHIGLSNLTRLNRSRTWSDRVTKSDRRTWSDRVIRPDHTFGLNRIWPSHRTWSDYRTCRSWSGCRTRPDRRMILTRTSSTKRTRAAVQNYPKT
jgi:hypothetical protein